MARLIGNSQIRLRNQIKQPILTKILTLKIVFIDDIAYHYKINCKKVNCFNTYDKQLKLDNLIQKELDSYTDSNHLKKPSYYFYDLNGNKIHYFDPQIETYLISIKPNNEWLYDKKYEGLLYKIIQLDCSTSSFNFSENKSRKLSQLYQSQQNVEHLIPQSSFRARILQRGILDLENVYDNFKLTSRQSSDPFLITHCRQKTSHQSTMSIHRISQSGTKTQIRTSKYLTEQEQYYINNLQKCQDDLEQYINKLKQNLSQDNEEIEKIIKFYENVIYPTPKSRALEMKSVGTSSLISTKLSKILCKQYPISKTHSIFGQKEKELLYSIPPLLHLNIPSLQAKYRLTRSSLYGFFSLYKVLHLITGYLKIQQNSPQVHGIIYDVYRNGIETIQDQAENMAKGIFDIIDSCFTGVLDWNQFLYLMSSVQAKTRDQRIDLFIKIADTNKDGQLSYQEVVKLSRQTLQKFIKDSNKEFLEEMSQFFSKVIFDSVGIDYEDEIPFKSLKDCINQGHPNSDLLCMFCGADS